MADHLKPGLKKCPRDGHSKAGRSGFRMYTVLTLLPANWNTGQAWFSNGHYTPEVNHCASMFFSKTSNYEFRVRLVPTKNLPSIFIQPIHLPNPAQRLANNFQPQFFCHPFENLFFILQSKEIFVIF